MKTNTNLYVPPVQLPDDFHACERGNVYLTSNENLNHIAWFRLQRYDSGDFAGKSVWLQVSVVPENYPSVNVSTIFATDVELAEHINTECEGFIVRKINLAGVHLIERENVVGGIDIEVLGNNPQAIAEAEEMKEKYYLSEAP